MLLPLCFSPCQPYCLLLATYYLFLPLTTCYYYYNYYDYYFFYLYLYLYYDYYYYNYYNY